jgi:hypothetical protein
VNQLIRCIILFISLITFLFPKKTATACGMFIFPGEYRFWLLQPDLTNEADLTPFFFASTFLYKDDRYNVAQSSPDQNLEEWYAKVHGNASVTDIDTILNYTSPDLFFDNQDTVLRQNSLTRCLKRSKYHELAKYLFLSKKVEDIAGRPDPWEESEWRVNVNITNVISELKQLRDNTKDDFVKLRSDFQILKLYNYSKQGLELNKYYDKYVSKQRSKSWIKAASLYQKALATGGPEANIVLARVFDSGDYNRTECLVKYQTGVTETTLPLARNAHERLVLKAMEAFNYPGRSLSLIRDIYNTEPGYREIPFLLLREINKTEDWLVTQKMNDFGSPAGYGSSRYFSIFKEDTKPNYQRDFSYAGELYRFLLQAISTSNKSSRALLNVYASHLCLLRKDYKAGSHHLEEAKKQRFITAKLQTQILINQFLLELENGFSKTVENNLMQILAKSDQELAIGDAEIMRNQLVLYTARKLIAQGNRAKGLMLLTRSNRALGELPISDYKKAYQVIAETAIDTDYDEMLAILNKKNKTPFEKYVTIRTFRNPHDRDIDNYRYEYKNNGRIANEWSQDRLLDCKASWYLRQHRLNDAFETTSRITDSFYNTYPYSEKLIGGDPFFVDIYRSYRITSADKRSLNKKQVISQMVYLENLALSAKDKSAECYFQLANSWYNMTYYGKNWLMVKQYRSSNEMSTWEPEFKLTTFNRDYYGCRYAKSFYLKALQLTSDKKLKALCMLMIAKCDKNNRDFIRGLKDKVETEAEKKYQRQKDLGEAKQKGIDLKHYNSLVEECELYQSFIQQYNRQL